METRYNPWPPLEQKSGQTKWDLLQQRLEWAKTLVKGLEDEINWMEKTPFPSSLEPYCSGCHTKFETEADFAKHYIVPDPTLMNLGYCPNKPKTYAPEVDAWSK